MYDVKLIILSGVLVVTAGAAQASPCWPRAQLVDNLQKGYAEQLAGRGLRGETNLFEVFTSADGATWTILQTFPNGMSCVVASGNHWIENALEPVAEGLPG